MFQVYAIQSEIDGRIYIGMTENIETRLEYHNKGWNTSTKGYRPWKLVYTEGAINHIEARQREKYFESGTGRAWLKEYTLNKKD